MATQSIGNLVVNLLFEDKDLVKGTDKAKIRLTAFAAKVGDVANQIDRKLTSALAGATAALTAFAAAAGSTGAQFEKRMDEVAAVSGATDEEMKKLTATAREIGETTAFSASQAADGMINLARAGFKTNEIIDATRASLVLAGAGNIDLAKATDLVASTIRQFSLDASEAGRIADVFTVVTQNSRFSLESLADSMKYAGTVGASLGLSLEETTAGVAQFIDLGLEASTAGTNFREAMLSLVNPGKKAREALDGIGLSVADVNPQVVGFEGAMKALGNAGLDAAAAMDIFGLRAGANVAKISSTFANGTTKFGELHQALIDSAGSAEDTYKKMLDNVLGDVAIFKSSIEELFLRVFDAMQVPLRRLLFELTDRVKALQKYFTGLGEESTSAFDAITDAVLYLVDAAISLIPHLQNIAAAMVAAIVAAKGVSYAISVAKLSTAIGVDLVGAIKAAYVALSSLSLAGGFLFGAAVAGTVAAVGLLVAAVADLVSELTGAKEAAVQLNAALRASQVLREQGKQKETDIGSMLASLQDQIRARRDAGEAINQEERALLDLTAAQAKAQIEAGDLLAVYGELIPASRAVGGQFGVVIMDAVRETERLNELTEKSKKFLNDFVNVGVGPAANVTERIFNVQLFERATRELGMTIASYEDLATAVEVFGMRANDSQKFLNTLRDKLADHESTVADVTKTNDEWTDTTVEGARAAARKAAELEKLDKELLKEALYTLKVAQERDEERTKKLKEIEANRLFAYELQKLGMSFDDMAKKGTDAIDSIDSKMSAFDPVLTSVMGTVEKLGKKFADAIGKKAVAALNSAKDAAAGLVKSITSIFSPLFSITDLLNSGAESASDILDLDKKAAESAEAAALAEDALYKARKAGADASEADIQRLKESAQEARAEAELAQKAADDARASVGLGSNQSVSGSEDEIAARQVQAQADAIVEFLQRLVDAVPLIINAIIDELPRVITAVNESIPKIIDAVIAGIPDIVQAAAIQTPALIDSILQRVPDLLAAIGDGVKTIIGTLPALISSVLQNTDEIITALVDVVVEIVGTLVAELPSIFTAIVDALPDIIVALVEAVPTLMVAIIEAIPDIFLAVIGLVPELIFAIIELIPRIIVALGEGMLKVAGAFWHAFIDFFTEGIPNLVKSLWDQIVKFWTETIPSLAEDLGRRIADFFLEIVTLGLHKSQSEKDARERADRMASNVGSDASSLLALAEQAGLQVARAQSGIEYVPRTMATILEPGEGVIDALSNARRLARGPGMEFSPPAPGVGLSGPGRPGSGGRSILELIVQMDTQVVDAQLIDGVEEGRAPRTRKALRAASGVRTGFRRGKLNPWGG